MVEADVSPGDTDPDMHVALQNIMEELIDEVTLGLCFEIHRSCKIGSFFLDGGDDMSDTEYAIVDRPGVDVLGQVSSKKNYECVCPNCQRHLAASRFAPHLEKCMGMGRNSSRIASRRIANNQKHGSDESGQDDENDNDWNYAPESKRLRKLKKDKMSNSPRNRRLAKLRNNNFRKLRNGGDHHTTAVTTVTPASASISTTATGGAAVSSSAELGGAFDCPEVQEHVLNYETMSLEERKALLLTKCGVISEITKKMCTRSTKCAQHNDEQRRQVRQHLLRQSRTHDLEDIHIDIDTYDDAESQSLRESLQWEASSNSSNNSTSSTLKQQRTTTTTTTTTVSSSKQSGGGGGGGSSKSGSKSKKSSKSSSSSLKTTTVMSSLSNNNSNGGAGSTTIIPGSSNNSNSNSGSSMGNSGVVRGSKDGISTVSLFDIH